MCCLAVQQIQEGAKKRVDGRGEKVSRVEGLLGWLRGGRLSRDRELLRWTIGQYVSSGGVGLGLPR